MFQKFVAEDRDSDGTSTELQTERLLLSDDTEACNRKKISIAAVTRRKGTDAIAGNNSFAKAGNGHATPTFTNW